MSHSEGKVEPLQENWIHSPNLAQYDVNNDLSNLQVLPFIRLVRLLSLNQCPKNAKTPRGVLPLWPNREIQSGLKSAKANILKLPSNGSVFFHNNPQMEA